MIRLFALPPAQHAAGGGVPEPKHAFCTARGQELAIRGKSHTRELGAVIVVVLHTAETGEIDLQTLKVLGSYRRQAKTTEPVAFGIYGEVVEPGTIRVGDAVSVDRG